MTKWNCIMNLIELTFDRKMKQLLRLLMLFFSTSNSRFSRQNSCSFKQFCAYNSEKNSSATFKNEVCQRLLAPTQYLCSNRHRRVQLVHRMLDWTQWRRNTMDQWRKSSQFGWVNIFAWTGESRYLTVNSPKFDVFIRNLGLGWALQFLNFVPI